MAATAEAVLHDGSVIPVSVHGDGPALLLLARLEPYTPDEAATMRKWGGDPDLGPALVDGFSGSNRLIVADYEGHRMAHPATETLTPDNLAADLLAIADAGGTAAFGYYGYSWLALAGLQLALRTDRLRALAMGGFPPRDGPYRSMLAVTRAAHAASTRAPDPSAISLAEAEPGDWDSVAVQTTEAQTRQFVTLYEALQDFDDVAAAVPASLSRLAFAGANDQIDYSEQWGGVRVSIGEPLAKHRDVLLADGWDVQVLPGLDHLGAMHGAVVLPLLGAWLRKVGWVRD
ncbi:pimeloyl-ACP methyl ester carboxylesterase [Pseudarthrobacter sp. W1I19]|uniref:alpha/beta hydrolase n=1 Tax=Pseudarthrobacter sp. W1I19 TaxID=3042288 RepID=UPI0027889D2B|nr:alpha/beta hydrolase [Pseudarthrobacter sp. W1I19]MDQ0924674.1 pimeloyl-ACP methyl ester carboxylesterase [Pseudarthrobacter sp. W1I19]